VPQVAELKKIIETAQGFGADTQKLIFAGKILKDDVTLAESAVKENDFLVCMVSKVKRRGVLGRGSQWRVAHCTAVPVELDALRTLKLTFPSATSLSPGRHW
jgi:hypothetical protein